MYRRPWPGGGPRPCRDAYTDLPVKAAALLHSLCVNHALTDGNKRLAFAACAMFLQINAQTLAADDDPQFDVVMAVAAGSSTT
jgi:death-on-curing protein